MIALGVICLIASGCFFIGSFLQDYVTHQTTYLICWLGFGMAGMCFLILDKLNDLIKVQTPPATKTATKKAHFSQPASGDPVCPDCGTVLKKKGADSYLCMHCQVLFDKADLNVPTEDVTPVQGICPDCATVLQEKYEGNYYLCPKCQTLFSKSDVKFVPAPSTTQTDKPK